jgi:PAS domain S-box-containing protein
MESGSHAVSVDFSTDGKSGPGPGHSRKLLLWMIAVPIATFAFALAGERAGYYSSQTGSALQAAGNVVVLAILLVLTLRRLQATDTLLERASERFRRVIESAPNAILLVDRHRKITLINGKTEEMFGYARAEIVGRDVESLIPQRFRERHPEYIRAFFSSPQARPMGAGRELFGLHKNGSEVPIEIGLNFVETQEGLYALASVVDITERKRSQDELRRSNAELEQFAYVASHDLQEPLRMVASYTELLGQRYRGQLDDKADKYIHYAVDGAKRMQQLVADLLAYSRVGSQGKPPLPVDAGGVLQSVLKSLDRLVRDAEATIEIGTLPTVMADETQLRQLFQNMLGNAIKFRGAAPPRVEVRAVPDLHFWRFSFADNGIGIEMQYAEKIFQMFQRLHSIGKYEGSGIGLAISKRIVERHGGRIWLESTPGVGTIFYFTLPRATTF